MDKAIPCQALFLYFVQIKWYENIQNYKNVEDVETNEWWV